MLQKHFVIGALSFAIAIEILTGAWLLQNTNQYDYLTMDATTYPVVAY